MKKITTIGLSIFSVFILCSLVYSPVIADIEDEKIVELHVELINYKGIDKYTLNITEECEIILDSIFNDLEDKLKGDITQDETILLLNETIAKLVDIGILINSSNLKETQKLISTINQNKEIQNYFEKNKVIQNENINNFICYIIGQATEIYSIIPIGNFLAKLYYIISEWDEISNRIPILLGDLIYYIFALSLILPFLNGGVITFGNMFKFVTYEYYPSNGWIWTLGLLGIKKWDGTFYGQLGQIPQLWPPRDYYIGANGFTGIKIHIIKDKVILDTFLLGSAFKVSIGSNHP